jgi:hypothetical protein
MSRLTTEEVDELIANGRRLVNEAKEAMAKSKKFFSEHNIDPRDALAFVRQHGGEPAVQAVEAQVKAAIQKIEEDAQRLRVHTPKMRPAGQRPRMRSNMI